MKLIFVDKNPELIERIKELKMFQAYVWDIRDYVKDNLIVTCSNPNFTFWGWVDAVIKELYPEECKQKQAKKWENERIGNVIFTITVDNNIQSSKLLVMKALKSIFCFAKEEENVVLTGLWTAIGWLSIDDFIEVLKDFLPNRAFKGFDKWLKCRDFKFKIGKEFTEKTSKLCSSWFHYCRNIKDINKFYTTPNHICEVEILWETDFWLEKECTTSIRIVRELSEYELEKIDWNTGHSNTGDSNTGDSNTGDRNTGHSNTGHWNTGHRNTGDRNTGHWNTGHRNTGYFNTEIPFANFFDKSTKIKPWDYTFPNFFFLDTTKWIYIDNMTPEERKEHPEADTIGGYLQKIEYKEAWKRAWNWASEKEKKETLKLPNFDNKKFLEITGIDVKKELK